MKPSKPTKKLLLQTRSIRDLAPAQLATVGGAGPIAPPHSQSVRCATATC
ncbi:MAG: hypothetical protein K8W52_47385 [Deltaproteobacteria bacterium]|nr:hypothetical protein [Deltaproteobacteria bacterium]